MKTPYLVQRATILTPLMPPNTRLSKAVNFDYMGSSEFEWGALPKAFKASSLSPTLTLKFIQEQNLRILLPQGITLEEYLPYLDKMKEQKLRLKESISYGLDPKDIFHQRDNFWWDIENNVMWSHHKQFMKRLPNYLRESFVWMKS